METKEYYNQLSVDYDEVRDNPSFRFFNNQKIDILREYIKDKKILEIGCATGNILKETSKYSKEAIGIDISEEMLKRAKEKGLNVLKASAINLPFEDNSFDVVYSFMVLPHIKDISKVIKEIKRVTKEQGKIIIEFYNSFGIRNIRGLFNKKVYRRADNYFNVMEYTKGMKLEMFIGLRIITPFSKVYYIPILNFIFKRLELFLSKTLLKYFGFYNIYIFSNVNKNDAKNRQESTS